VRGSTAPRRHALVVARHGVVVVICSRDDALDVQRLWRTIHVLRTDEFVRVGAVALIIGSRSIVFVVVVMHIRSRFVVV
jgi:ribosomal protein L36